MRLLCSIRKQDNPHRLALILASFMRSARQKVHRRGFETTEDVRTVYPVQEAPRTSRQRALLPEVLAAQLVGATTGESLQKGNLVQRRSHARSSIMHARTCRRSSVLGARCLRTVERLVLRQSKRL